MEKTCMNCRNFVTTDPPGCLKNKIVYGISHYPCSSWEQDKRLSEDNHNAVQHPNHYTGNIECIDYIRDKLTADGFTDFCIGNVIKYISRWRKKDGVQDLKKAAVYMGWAIEQEEKQL